MNIEEDPYIQNLYQSRNLKPSTRKWYNLILRQYCKFLDKTPTELLNEAINEEEQGIRKINRKLKTYFIQYRQHLIEKGQSPLSIKNTMTIIRSFYNEYEIDLPKLKLNLPKEERLITKDDLIQKDDIIKALKYANRKYRAIILLMASSGMGSSEVRYLTVNDFLKSIELSVDEPLDMGELIKKVDKNNIPCATWRITRVKTGMPYFTFSSPESIYATLDYLQEREHKNGTIPLDSPLFVYADKQMSPKSFVDYFQQLNDTCGFSFFGRQRFFHAHGLRKFFATTLQEHRVQQLVIEWLLGHKVNLVTGAYIKPDINALRHDYLRVLPYLSVEKVETRTVESMEYRELKEKYENDSQKKSAEIESLTEKLEKLEKRQDLIDELQDNPEYLNKVSKMKKTS